MKAKQGKRFEKEIEELLKKERKLHQKSIDRLEAQAKMEREGVNIRGVKAKLKAATRDPEGNTRWQDPDKRAARKKALKKKIKKEDAKKKNRIPDIYKDVQ